MSEEGEKKKVKGTLHFRLPPEMRERLDREADRRCLKSADIVRQAILEYFKSEEAEPAKN